MTISRRDFLKASGLVAAWSALAACTPNTPPPPNPTPNSTQTPTPFQPMEPTQTATPSAPIVLEGEPLLLHTLRRITFGPTPEMLDHARSLGLEAFIEEQLFPDSIPDTEI